MANRLVEQHRDLIEEQRGVVARWQLGDSARDLSAVDALCRRDRWQTLYRGVYVTYPGSISRVSTLWAAVRRCGPQAVLSYTSAAELDRLIDEPDRVVHVTIPGRSRIRLAESDFTGGAPQIILHRSTRLETARHPAKTPPRTRVAETVLDLTDLARDFEDAFSWLSSACSRGLVTAAQLRVAAGQRARLRCRADVLGALDEVAAGVASNLELRFVSDVERPHRLPRPQRQARMRREAKSAYLDNLYGEFGLAVELDGLTAHPPQDRWRDIYRDNHFAALGITTLRYNWADVTQRPCVVAGQIAAALRQRGWTGTPRRCGDSCHAYIPDTCPSNPTGK